MARLQVSCRFGAVTALRAEGYHCTPLHPVPSSAILPFGSATVRPCLILVDESGRVLRPMSALSVSKRGLGMSLEKFGWNSYFENEFARYAGDDVEPARIALADRERFVVWTDSGERDASVAGRLRYESDDWPAVGDWVALEAGARISAVLPRQSAFSRKEAGAVTREQVIAANIDVLFVVAGLDGDFNLRRLERYLLLAWESGAKPVVVLNKADLCANIAQVAADVQALASGAPVVAISALEGWGVPEIEAHLRAGQTAALTG